MINLLVALPAEAKPLNQHLGLKRIQPDGDLPIYRKGNTQLVLCGVGRARAARASQYLCSGSTTDYWINIGIAGHPSAAVGELFQVNQVSEKVTGNEWELPYSLISPPTLSRLITVDEPAENYPENALYDMEASGLVAVLAAQNQLERTTILKIVSDNLSNPTTQISGRQIKSLISIHLDTIDRVLHAINH